MSETKIKPNQIENGGVLEQQEFFITEEFWNEYKISYHSGGEVLDLAQLIEHEDTPEDLNGNKIINLNGYRGVFDGYEINNSNFIIKNGSLVFDNPEEGGCGRAISINDGFLEIDNCDIDAPLCSDNTDGIIELNNNSNLKIVNCSIEAKIGENNKPFIKTASSFIYISNSKMSLSCMNDLQDPNIRFDFINVIGNGGGIEIRNCQALRMANDAANTDDLEFNFIKTDENKTVEINLFNNVIQMQGRGWYRNILNINLDNQNCQISNNDLQGNLYCRYESSNTVNDRFAESGGEPVTFEQGDAVWDLGLDPQQADGSKGFEFDSIWDFCEAVDVDMNDMSKLYNRYQFTWKDIDGQSGFIFQYDDQQTYTTDDLISISDLENDYSIRVYDDQPENWNDGNWIAVVLNPFAQKFRINETFTIEHNYEFPQQVQDGKAEETGASVNSFNNNSFNSMAGGYNEMFLSNNSLAADTLICDGVATRRLVLNHKEYTSIPEDGVFHPTNNEELWDIFNREWGGVIDFMNFQDGWDYNGYELSNKNFTFRNLMVNSNWQPFPYFEKPLFKFNDCGITFMNCAFNIQNIDLSNTNDVKSLFEFNNTNADYRNVTFMNCGINVNNLQNGSGKTVNIIKLNDHQLEMENCSFDFQGNNNIGYGNFINSSISNNINDAGKTQINMKYSSINMWGFNNDSTCIKYEDDCEFETRMNINYSTLNSQNMRVIVPNNSEINAKFSDVNAITCIERDPNDFTDWQATTQYNQDDLVVWTNPGNQNDKRYFKVLQQFTTTGDSWGDVMNAMGNDNIGWYYTTEVRGVMYNAFDPNNFIQNFQSNGMFGMDGLNINNNFSCNQTNRFYIKMQDQNINGGNDTDVLSAISELASRLSAIEPN